MNWGVFFYLHLDWWGNFPSSLKWNTKTTEKESILTRLGKLSGHQIFSAANTPVWSTPKCEPVEDVSETEKTPLRIHRKPKIKGLKLRSCKILQFFVTSRWRMVLLAGHHGTFLISDHEARLHRFRWFNRPKGTSAGDRTQRLHCIYLGSKIARLRLRMLRQILATCAVQKQTLRSETLAEWYGYGA